MKVIEYDARRELTLSFHWHGLDHPVPTRKLASRASAARGGAPANGSEAPTFEFSHCLRLLCTDITRRSAELAHIDVSRLLIGMTHARNRRRHGLQARITPLRFEDGALTTRRRGITYRVQRYFVDGREMLYHLAFCLPRFLDLDFREKLITVFHELYHIHPAFNGDLRRHHGRCCIHSRSKQLYDLHMARLVDAYLATGPDPTLHHPLRLRCQQLLDRHDGIRAILVPRPKLLPIAGPGLFRK